MTDTKIDQNVNVSNDTKSEPSARVGYRPGVKNITYYEPKRKISRTKHPLLSLLSLVPEYQDSKDLKTLNETSLGKIVTTDGKRVIKYPECVNTISYTKYALTTMIGYHPVVGVITTDGNVVSGKSINSLDLNMFYRAVLSLVPMRMSYVPRPWYQKPRYYQDIAYDTKEELDNLHLLNSTPDEIISKYYHLRHDLFQILVCWKYGLTLRLDTEHSFKDLKELGIVQTPDIFEYSPDEKEGLYGDVQITPDVSRGYHRKVAKYSHLSRKFNKIGVSMNTFYMVCKPDLSNYELSISNASLKPIHNLNHHVYWSSVNKCYEALMIKMGPEAFRRYNSLMHEESSQYKFKHFQHSNKWCSSSLERSLGVGKLKKLIKDYSERKSNPYHDKVYSTSENEETFTKINTDNKRYQFSDKPSLHMLIPPDTHGLSNYETYPEQNQIRQFCRTFRGVSNPEASKVLSDLDKLLSDEEQFKYFCTGFEYPGEAKLRDKYHKYRSSHIKKSKKQRYLMSFENFCKEEGLTRSRGPDQDRVEKRKVCRMHFKGPAETFMKKSGINYLKKNQNIRKYKPKHSCDITLSGQAIDDFLDVLTEKIEYSDEKLLEELKTSGPDTKLFKNEKDKFLSMGRDTITKLSSYYSYKFLRHSSLAYEQLIHMGNNSCRPNNISLFTTGLPNFMVLLTGGYRGFNQSSGKSYTYMGFTKNKDVLDPKVFGKLTVCKYNGGYFYMSGWRRLSGHRLEFMRDSHLSVLSSTINSLSRYPEDLRYKENSIRGTLSLRTLVSLCPNTGFITKIADCRYAILSALSTHTNFPEFIKEKLKPPYHNAMESWCIYKMWSNLSQFRNEATKLGSLEFREARFDALRIRSNASIGGRLNFMSVWSNRFLITMQDLLDEVYLYVHTPKEPVNEYHEEIGAIKTIQKFEKIFRNMSTDRRNGVISSPEELEDFLENHSNVGFCATFLDHAVKLRTRELDVDMDRICTNIATENIGEVQSTKAVIPEKVRTITPAKKTLMKAMVLRKSYIDEKKVPTAKSYIKRSIHFQERSVPMYHGRVKVHDALMVYMSMGFETVLEAAEYHLETSGRVLADICIKAQYGSKREFYVLNIGAKLIARVAENFFKSLCKASPNEMISVPGDDKFLYMQRLLDRQTMHAMKNGCNIKYVNGDCTKWSAAETMESFMVMLHAMEDQLDPGLYSFIHKTFDCWRNKKIQIPMRIVNRVVPVDSKTKYLLEAAKNDYQLESTQNFLQGVFNYTSSYKADCIAHTTISWYKEFYPESELQAEYLVHSDDYVWVVTSKSVEDFQRFRTLSKILMRLGGITDSVKKTNCQYIFMEFISLIGFNGAMCYPQIKKTKEVTTTLPCDSFCNDSAAVCSRTAECIRIGVPHYGAYMFHRLHMYQLRKCYGCHEGGHNQVEGRFKTPTSFFGQSDMHPLFYLMCTGDPNNYRLYKTGQKDILKRLYRATEKFGKTGVTEFLNPTFLYNRYTNRIKQVRNGTGLKPSEAISFFEQYPAYSYTKPKRIERLHQWSKSMYFMNSFVKAYNRDSRTIRMLRLSMFTKGKCLTTKNFEELIDFYKNIPFSKSTKTEYWRIHTLTIKEYMEKINNLVVEDVSDRMLHIYCLQGYSQVATFYGWSETVKLHPTRRRYYHSTVATKIPSSPNWLDITTPINMLILYLTNIDEFLREFPGSDRIPVMIQEINTLKKEFPEILEGCRSGDKMSCNAIYTILDSLKPPKMVVMGTNRHRSTLTEFLGNHFKRFSDPINYTNISGSRFVQTLNPYTLEGQFVDQRSKVSSRENMIANKLGVCIGYIVGRTSKSIRMLDDIPLVLSDGKRATMKEWIYNAEMQSLNQQNVSRLGTLAVGYYQSLMGNNTVLNNLISTGNSFLYTIDSSLEKKVNGKYSGILNIYIQYQNTISNTVYYHDTKKWETFVQTNFGPHAAMHTYYGLIMSGVVGKHFLDVPITEFDWPTIKAVKPGCLKKLGDTWKFDCKEGLNIPCYYKMDKKYKLPKHMKRPMANSSRIRIRGLSVFRGPMKHYTIKYDQYFDSDCFYLETDDPVFGVMNKHCFKDFLRSSTPYSRLPPVVQCDDYVRTDEKATFTSIDEALGNALSDFKFLEGSGILDGSMVSHNNDVEEEMVQIGIDSKVTGNFELVIQEKGESWRLSNLKSMNRVVEDMSRTLLNIEADEMTAGHMYYLYLLRDSTSKNTYLRMALDYCLRFVKDKLTNVNGHIVRYTPGTGPEIFEYYRVESKLVRENRDALRDRGYLGEDYELINPSIERYQTAYKPVKGDKKLKKWIMLKYNNIIKDKIVESRLKDSFMGTLRNDFLEF